MDGGPEAACKLDAGGVVDDLDGLIAVVAAVVVLATASGTLYGLATRSARRGRLQAFAGARLVAVEVAARLAARSPGLSCQLISAHLT